MQFPDCNASQDLLPALLLLPFLPAAQKGCHLARSQTHDLSCRHWNACRSPATEQRLPSPALECAQQCWALASAQNPPGRIVPGPAESRQVCLLSTELSVPQAVLSALPRALRYREHFPNPSQLPVRRLVDLRLQAPQAKVRGRKAL